MNIQGIAAEYRAASQGDESTGGYVLVYLGRAFGWKRALAAPETVCPGVLAVDGAGQVFEAQGGNDYDGALRWVAVAAQHA
jgi:hypothetical protein